MGKDVFFGVISMETSKRTKELPMTVPELKNMVYLLTEVAWPIIKQNIANTGNRLQCFEVTSDALGLFLPTCSMR